MSLTRVTVVVPENRSAELKSLASKWREAYRDELAQQGGEEAPQSYAPGGDAKAISRIATQHFGGFREMFVSNGWPERGSDMMRKVQARVKERYGSISEFERQYPPID